MKMNTRFWTFNTLVGAFLDLSIAYFLLCGSTIALFAVKFLGFFGLSLPNDSDYDYISLLVDCPTDKVSAVQFSATTKFPFDSILFGVHNHNLKDDLNLNRDDEASCSSRTDGRKVVGNESGFDLKGIGNLNGRLRRRRGSFDSGKQSSVTVSSNWVTCVEEQSNNDEENGGGPETSSVLSDFSNCNYEAETPMVVKSGSRYHEDIVFGDLNDVPFNEADKDKMIVLLTRKLEESQSARAALYVELEKERNAAASAADEAMSMILRLQEEKASVKMESRQYQRMIEEKSVYDEEEMNILKEIVLRREREKHFLEKQVEAYRQMILVQNDQINVANNQDPEQEEPEKTIASVGEENGLEIKPGDASRGGETVYDVHVIDNEPTLSEKSNGLDVGVGLPPVRSKSSLRRNSTSALDNERTRLDTEVQWLREKLRVVQEGRGKLNLSVDKESLQLQLLEDIARQLQEIQMLTEPRQASLPLPSSKVGVAKKRRSRSVSSGHARSS